MLWICVFDCMGMCALLLEREYIFMLSCTSVRVSARCLFSCSDQAHQGWLHRVSIKTVQTANVNLTSSNSPLPLGVNQHAVTDYLGFLGLFCTFCYILWIVPQIETGGWNSDAAPAEWRCLHLTACVQHITCWVKRPEMKMDPFGSCICPTDVVSGYFTFIWFEKC